MICGSCAYDNPYWNEPNYICTQCRMRTSAWSGVTNIKSVKETNNNGRSVASNSGKRKVKVGDKLKRIESGNSRIYCVIKVHVKKDYYNLEVQGINGTILSPITHKTGKTNCFVKGGSNIYYCHEDGTEIEVEFAP